MIENREIHLFETYPGFSSLFKNTGWHKSKLANSNCYKSESMHFISQLDKARMRLGGLNWFASNSCLFTISKWNLGPTNTTFSFTKMVTNSEYFPKF